MEALIQVILPVFLVVGLGYLAAWGKVISEAGIEGLMKFAQSFAIPILLFLALARLDLGSGFDWRMLVSFYTGAFCGFLAGLFGARFLFKRDWEDAVAVGFVCLFSNSVLLGLAISERAYGSDSLAPNYAIIALHAPFCYLVGVLVMEGVRARGAGLTRTAGRVVKSLATNPLVIGIGAGVLVNLSGQALPGVIADAAGLVARAGLPAALFGLGGVLFRYRPEGDLRLIAYAVAISLVLHPSITWVLGRLLDVQPGPFRSAVVTAGMAPGVNAYLFANMYGRARRVAASTVLIATGLCIFTAWGWMTALG
ncbi:AEC family transporter [Pararhodobacter zhoushanensis]|uniref:AEC family transporter n=1 Tax=Pararhodobacter zhoushanensis TaxID=2479545 RepID=UPI000F8DD166|nr:AEC family transporter [Pararhodobacter zhoushanensis]